MRFTVLMALTAIAFAGCNKPAATTESTEPTTPAPTPTPTPTPKPVVVAPKPEPVEPKVEAPPPKQLAPEGTLYALERISVVTDDGIYAVAAGTRLTIVRKTDTGFVVTDGKREFNADAHKVTNELQAAAGAALSTHAERQANAINQQAQFQNQAQMLEAQQQQAAAYQQGAEKDKRLRDLDARITALTREEAVLSAKIEESRQDEQRSRVATNVYGRVSTRTIDPNLRVQWQTRLALVKEDKRNSQNELNRLRAQ